VAQTVAFLPADAETPVISMLLTGHPFRQYAVLPCSPLFGIHNKTSALLRIAVLTCSPVFSSIKALTVVFDREFGGRF
jgi:hypothetical protein